MSSLHDRAAALVSSANISIYIYCAADVSDSSEIACDTYTKTSGVKKRDFEIGELFPGSLALQCLQKL